MDHLFKNLLGATQSNYYKLPIIAVSGIGFVLDTQAERAVEFRRKSCIVPVIFIDSVDILLRESPDDFLSLVGFAYRFHANQGHLLIV